MVNKSYRAVQLVSSSCTLDELRIALRSGCDALFDDAFVTCAIRESSTEWFSLLSGERIPAQLDCWAMMTNRTHVSGLAQSNPRCAHVANDFRGLTICTSLYAQGEFFGLLRAEWIHPPKHISLKNLVSRFEYLAVALSTSLFNIRSTEDALKDRISGLYSRRALDHFLPQHCAFARRSGAPLTLLMIDLDHFKAVNDVAGHLAGDEMIASVSRFLTRMMRTSDMGFRFGGDEFVAILPGTKLEDGQLLAEKLRGGIEQLPQVPNATVSASIGIAELHAHTESSNNPNKLASDLLRQADTAAYAAKQNGRNQIALPSTRLCK